MSSLSLIFGVRNNDRYAYQRQPGQRRNWTIPRTKTYPPRRNNLLCSTTNRAMTEVRAHTFGWTVDTPVESLHIALHATINTGIRPFIMQHFSGSKLAPICPFCLWLHFRTSLYERRILCAALCKSKHFTFFLLRSIIRRPPFKKVRFFTKVWDILWEEKLIKGYTKTKWGYFLLFCFGIIVMDLQFVLVLLFRGLVIVFSCLC